MFGMVDNFRMLNVISETLASISYLYMKTRRGLMIVNPRFISSGAVFHRFC